MSNLSELLPAGAGAKSAEFVASGTLGSGVTVALNSDGSVSAVASDGSSSELGSLTTFSTSDNDRVTAAYDVASQKIVIAYRDNGNSSYGTAIVGTVSGVSITFGTAVVFASGNADNKNIVYDANAEKVVIAYQDRGNSAYGTAIVGTVSGTSISFGSATVFETANAGYIGAAYDSTAQKVVISYTDYGNSSYGTAIVGTVSGTSISFGSAVVFESASVSYSSAVYDPDQNKTIIAYRDTGNSGYGTAIVSTVSGTSISFGTAVVFNTASTNYTQTTYDTANDKVVIGYQDGGNSDAATAIVGTVSGTSISFGSEATASTELTQPIGMAFDASSGKVIFVYRDFVGGATNGTFNEGTVSGTSISFGSKVVWTTDNPDGDARTGSAAAYDSGLGRVVIVNAPTIAGNDHGKAIVYKGEGSNNTDFIGITDQAIADTATGAVIVQGGVSEKVSGLTVGADYYVQADGSLASSSIPFDISGASYDSVSFGVSAQDATPTSIRFNTTGTKMFVIGESSDNVNEYNLSIAFDISTSVFNQSFSVSAQEIQPRGLAFNNNGTKMFVVGGSGDDVNEYVLSVGFDISTSAFSQNFSVSTEMFSPSGIAFNSDGTKMFVCGSTNDSVFEYYLTSGFDISTASFVDSISVSSEEASPLDIAFNNDGTKMFIAGATGDAVYEYSLLTGFDISTATYVISFSVAGEESTIQGIAFNTTGTKFYITGSTTDAVYQYSTTAASTTVPAGRALSSTSILLEG